MKEKSSIVILAIKKKEKEIELAFLRMYVNERKRADTLEIPYIYTYNI